MAYVGRHQVEVGSLGRVADRSRLAGEVPCAWEGHHGEWGGCGEQGASGECCILRDVPSLLFY